MKLPTKLKPELAAISIIILFFIVFFWPATLNGQIFVTGDSLIYSYPMRLVAWTELRRGALPLWTPVLLSGFPLLAMAQVAVGYPLTWFYLILPGHYAEQIYILAPFVLAPSFVYAYLRAVGRSRLASLMGGLSFAYGGLMAGGLSHNGMFTNAVMWLPLLLLAIERARMRPLIPCLIGAAAAYAMSVLTGLGQGFLYAGIIALAYAVFLSLFLPPGDAKTDSHRIGWRRWKPLIAGVGGMAAATGLAAFQILETMRAQSLSIRHTLTYEIFSGGAFSPREWFLALIAPLYHFNWEVTSYLPLLVVCLALAAVLSAAVWRRERRRIIFWSVVALLGALLMMGDHTPLYRLAYHIPGVNLFRIPWRHAFEWTFAASLLAAYGWDAVGKAFARLNARRKPQPDNKRMAAVIAAALFSSSLLVAFTIWKLANRPVVAGLDGWPTGLAEKPLIAWKIGLTLLLLATICWAHLKLGGNRGKAALAATLVLACFWEQYLYVGSYWFVQIKPASYFTEMTPAMRFLQEHAGQYRIYTSAANLFGIKRPRAEPHNLPAKYGFQNAAGYEPLLTERYAQAFGSGWNFTTPSFHAAPDQQILDPRWQALDLLNVKYLVEFTIPPANIAERYGAKFSPYDNLTGLAPGKTIRLSGTSEPVDRLSFVSSLAHSGDLAQGEPAARLIIHTTDGRRLEHELKAGVDTAEWAHDRADVRPTIQHARAPIFDSSPGDATDSFPAHRYWSELKLETKAPIAHLEIANVCRRASISLFRITAYDATRDEGTLLVPGLPDQWRKVYADADARIYENQRVLPRVWLAGHAEVVNDEEALRRIRGEDERPFDPRQTALLEIAPENLPQELLEMANGELGEATQAQIVGYEPNRLAVETNADKRAALVLSEINYPGWEATIDEQPTTIFTANYLLRAVIVPEGRHRVEMRYTAPAARRGAIISALTLLALITGAIFYRLSWRIKK